MEENSLEVAKLRRDFHKYPELGFTEFRTASIVVEKLKALNYRVIYGKEVMEEASRKGVPSNDVLQKAYDQAITDGANPDIIKEMKEGFTAVIGKLVGKKPGPTVAFRFDMDALPIKESDDKDHFPSNEKFRSIYDGIMHACGHDGHTAIGVSLAETFKNKNFSGTLMLIFQPAEEGGRGAKAIVDKGVIDHVNKLYCMHLGLNVPFGEVSGGTYGWLATTKMKSHFMGIPSHSGAAPEKGRNALVGAATALLNIHGLPRYSGGKTRVNVGALNGGSAPNIIPNEATMIIETRSDVASINQDLEGRIRKIVEHSALMHDLDYKIETIGEGTTIICDDNLVNIVVEEAQQISRIHTVHDLCSGGGSEDASFLIQRVQECGGEATYMLVGTSLPAPHHHSRFDVEEESLELAVELLYRIATRELSVNE